MRSVVFAMALVIATPAGAQDVGRWRTYIVEASLRFGVPTNWIERVIRAESAGWTTMNGRPIRSRAGAMGLMQLMPVTWAAMRARLQLGTDPDDPRDNILAGTAYLRLLYDRFGYPGLFAAYNAGPARYADYLGGAKPLPRETTGYLQTVAGTGPRPQFSRPNVAPPALFAVRRDAPTDPTSGTADNQPAAGLFAIQRGLR